MYFVRLTKYLNLGGYSDIEWQNEVIFYEFLF